MQHYRRFKRITLIDMMAGVYPNSLDSSCYEKLSSSNTVVRLDSNDGNIGTTFSFENDLNLDDTKSTFYGAFTWRMSGRH